MITNITGKTRLLGLVGNPVEHSVSPQLHNTLCSFFNINAAYLPFGVLPEDFVKVVEALKSLDVIGFNVTIPYKVEIMKLLDSISEEALLIGAVNTVKIVNRKMHGFNTDGQGFIRSLREAGFEGRGSKIIILGAGGAARSVAVKLAQESADRIIILNRSREKAESLAELINSKVRDVATFSCMTEDALLKHSRDCDIIINTTPAGMWPDLNKVPVESAEIFENKPFVYDLIYNPIKTKFLSMAEENSCRILNGLGMLIYQGVSAFEIWTGMDVPDEISNGIITDFTNVLS